MTMELTKFSLPVQCMQDLKEIGNAIAASGLLGLDNAASGMVVAMTCYQEGITPIDFSRMYHIVNGRPCKKADYMAAEFRTKGGKYKIIERSESKAAAKFFYEDQEVDFVFTIEQAKRAGLVGGKNANWNHYPENMLWARMMSNAIRVLCPEVNAGVYTPEEAGDFSETRSSEPQVLSPDEVLRRAKQVQPIETTVDYSKCPDGFGEFSGMAWLDMPLDVLRGAMESEKLSDEYKEEIKVAGQLLAEKEGAA